MSKNNGQHPGPQVVEAPSRNGHHPPAPTAALVDEVVAFVELISEGRIAHEREKVLGVMRDIIGADRTRQRTRLDYGDFLDADGESEAPHRSNRTRRYVQWAVAQTDLRGPLKTFLFAVSLRMSSEGDASHAKPPRMARDCSVSLATLYKLLKESRDAGLLTESEGPYGGQYVVALPNDDPKRREALGKLWRTPRGGNPDGPTDTRMRWRWEREVRDSKLTTVSKGTAWAISQLSRPDGIPIRQTTRGELARFSGFKERCLTHHLGRLEEGGWVVVERVDGRVGGLLLTLREPEEVQERRRIREELEDGNEG